MTQCQCSIPPRLLQAYSGSADVDAGLFVMEYELEGELVVQCLFYK